MTSKKRNICCYSMVWKDFPGVGVVQYRRRKDMEYALRKLDNTKFKNPKVSCEY